jgi:predicted phage-related endonuclease
MSAVLTDRPPALLKQGSPEWLAYRRTKRNASDAPAMMGCSPYETRSALLRRVHSGIDAEVDSGKQRLFDEGHGAEALCRLLAEQLIGEDLVPAVVARGDLSASLDGRTLMADCDWEHKLMRDELRSLLPVDAIGSVHVGDSLPLYHRVQIAHQQHCSGAKRTLFSASKWKDDGTLAEPTRHCWVRRDERLIADVLAGWEQFEVDLAAYVPTDVVPAVTARAVESLPAVSVRLDGQLAVQSNLPAFGAALKAFVAKIPARPATDQEFADAEAACKSLKKAEDALEAAESNAMAGIANVEAMRRMVADFKDVARTARLASEKMVKARKEQIREDECRRGRQAVDEHMQALNARLGQRLMPMLAFNFPEAIKGLKTIDSVRNAIDTEIARVKIEANTTADKIDANLKAIAAAGAPSLFPDAQALVLKAADDLAAVIAQRLAVEHQRQEKERERIRAEEAARIEREQAADRARAIAEMEKEEAARQRAGASAELPAAILGRAETLASDKREAAPYTPPGTHSAAAAPAMLAGAALALRSVTAPHHPDGPPTLKLGAMSERLGFTVSRDFIDKTLGFTPATVEKGHGLWSQSAWPLICAAIAEHVLECGETQ